MDIRKYFGVKSNKNVSNDVNNINLNIDNSKNIGLAKGLGRDLGNIQKIIRYGKYF